MTVNQVYSIVNGVTKQIFGDQAITATDLTGLISIGQEVLSSQTNKDKFLNTLVDRIGKTIVSSRPYSADVLGVLKDPFEFGAVLQKIYVEPIDATASAQWDLTGGSSVDKYVISKPTVRQQLFSGINSWDVDLTIPDIQLKSAFTNPGEMASLIDALFLSMRNSMEVQLEAMLEMTYANFIGERLVNTKTASGHTVIDLLGDYNTLFDLDPALTASEAMYDKSFLKYATTQISLYKKLMGRMSTLYNGSGYKRFTTDDYMRITCLANFSASCKSYLEADTYHNDLVALPNYAEIPFWQGSGTAVGFTSASTVKIKTASGYDVNQDGVVLLMSDVQALGITIDNRRSLSTYNERGEYTNYFEKADMGYYNDLSENGLVFVVSDTIATPTKQS